MIQVLSGISVAAGVFAAVLWSVFQVVTQTGKLRSAHMGAIAFSLAGMASISYVSPIFAMIAGAALALASIATIWMEPRWNKLFPFFQLIFAISLILGLPFTGI